MAESLRSLVIRLAASRPDLRAHLLPLVQKVAGPTVGRRGYVLVFAKNANYVMSIQQYVGNLAEGDTVDEGMLANLAPGAEVRIGHERVVKIDVGSLPLRWHQLMFVLYEETPSLETREQILQFGVSEADLRNLSEHAQAPTAVSSNHGPLKVLAVRAFQSEMASGDYTPTRR